MARTKLCARKDRGYWGRTPLRIAPYETTLGLAVLSKNIRAVNDILVSRPAQVDDCAKDGCTPLIHSVAHHSVDMTCRLLQAGADVNLADHDGWTPLIHAIYSGGDHTLSTVQTLVELGADARSARHISHPRQGNSVYLGSRILLS